MTLRSPVMFSGAFLLLAIVYGVAFNIAIRVDAGAAHSRFDALMTAGSPGLAADHGQRALGLLKKDGAPEQETARLKAEVARAETARGRHARSAALLTDALASDWSKRLTLVQRIALEDDLARAHLKAGAIEQAAAIYVSFLELAGDAAAQPEGADRISLLYAARLDAAADAFLRVVHHASPHEIRAETPEQILASANHFADLGGHFAMGAGDEYAAAGLLAAAYEARRKALGGDHQSTVQLTLMLGPLYERMGRLKDAEKLYLDAFHAQERAKGANSPDLSLYVKLLAGVYEKQERFTEAQALFEHLRGLFRDAFGAQRYSANREVDRRSHINRPVSQFFPLENDYAPGDLVSAAEYSVPTSKAPSIDEMKLRLAPDADPEMDKREANLPVRLAQLISLCRSVSGEAVSLRSGYRSYSTQRALHQRNLDRGTVTPAGVSEHQTGLAVDINVNGRFMRQSDRSYQCFEENAFRYGFILSYPPGNNYLPTENSYEPWHWRYVGVQTAQLYREAGPHNRPQEFLAALPCYQERAANGAFPTAGERDVCLDPGTQIVEVSIDADDFEPGGGAARILNQR